MEESESESESEEASSSDSDASEESGEQGSSGGDKSRIKTQETMVGRCGQSLHLPDVGGFDAKSIY